MSEKIRIEVIVGPEGKALYINDYRISGPKPWAGGTVIAHFEIEKQELLKQLKQREDMT